MSAQVFSVSHLLLLGVVSVGLTSAVLYVPEGSREPCAKCDCSAAPAPIAVRVPASVPATHVEEVRTECVLSPQGALFFFHEKEKQNALWTIHCRPERDTCDVANFKMGATRLSSLSLNSSRLPVRERTSLRILLSDDSYQFEYSKLRGSIIETFEGEVLAEIPCRIQQ